tara:strand:+ start:185 stop:484 length:300 start_codon:yes stop_codon:yes gene_type:complete
MKDTYRLVSLVCISIIIFLIILFNFTKTEFVVFSVILGVVFIFLAYSMENYFEYFEWEEESDPIFPDYHKKNEHKLTYRISKSISKNYLENIPRNKIKK